MVQKLDLLQVVKAAEPGTWLSAAILAPLRRTLDAFCPRLMSLAGWLVLGGGSGVTQQFERQAVGATRQLYAPGGTSIRDGRIYEFPGLVSRQVHHFRAGSQSARQGLLERRQ